jgi:hypothetical protein
MRALGVARAARSAWSAIALGCGLSAAVVGGCGGAEPEPETPAPVAKAPAKSDFNPCEGKGPPAKVYEGLARDARCEQEVFLTMAGTATALGRDCDGCHVRKEGGGKDDYDYPVMTDQKRVANWMKHQFNDRLVHKDGSPVKCASCHKAGAKDGKPAGKFLGTPRDKKYAMEWMNLVMVNEFRTADGGKLTCKHCHGAAPTMAGFQPKVILSDGLVTLPLRKDVPAPRSPAGVPSLDPAAAPPAASASPSDAPAVPAAPAAPAAPSPPK